MPLKGDKARCSDTIDGLSAGCGLGVRQHRSSRPLARRNRTYQLQHVDPDGRDSPWTRALSLMKPIACVVLAGGLVTRLRAAVPDLPKCLAPVGGQPFLDLQLTALRRQGVDRFVLSLGYLAETVREAASRFQAAEAVTCVVESHALGTGGAILHVMNATGLEEALVINGDTFIEADLALMMAPLDLLGGELARMAAVQVADRARYGGVELSGTAVCAFVEKGRQGAGLINAGLYRLHRSVFGAFQAGQAFSLETQVMPGLLQQAALRAAVLDGEFIDIGVPEDYYAFCSRHAGSA